MSGINKKKSLRHGRDAKKYEARYTTTCRNKTDNLLRHVSENPSDTIATQTLELVRQKPKRTKGIGPKPRIKAKKPVLEVSQ